MNFDHITQETVQQFIDSGADINTTGSYNGNKSYTLLHAAIDNGDIESVKLILSKNPNLNALVANYGPVEDDRDSITNEYEDYSNECEENESFRYYSPLHIAVYNNQLEIVKLLLSYGADINIKINNCHSALNTAIKTANIELIKLLVESGADVNNISSFKIDPDDQSYYCDKDSIPATLKGYAPLHVAIKTWRSDRYQVVELLLEHGADVDCNNSSGYYIQYSPICLAIQYNLLDLVKLLVSYGAETNDNGALITFALKLKKFDLVRFLIRVGFDVNNSNSTKESETAPLSEVANNNNANMVELLIINGAMKPLVNRDHCILESCSGYIHSIFKEHIVKVKVLKDYAGELESVDMSSSEAMIPYNYEQQWIKFYESKCKEELEKMQRKFIGTSSLSYYELLKKNIYQLGMFAKNPSIAEVLSSNDVEENFPVYAEIIRNCFEKGEYRKELLEQVEQQLHDILSQLPYSFVVEVFTYLKNDDLRCFIKYLSDVL